MVTWTDKGDGEQRLTEGEEEGIKANLTTWRNLRDEPFCYTADGHWRSSHIDCSYYWLLINYRTCKTSLDHFSIYYGFISAKSKHLKVHLDICSFVNFDQTFTFNKQLNSFLLDYVARSETWTNVSVIALLFTSFSKDWFSTAGWRSSVIME